MSDSTRGRGARGLFCWLLPILLSIGLTACGGGGSGSETPAPPPVTVTAPAITTQPAAATAEVGATATFTVAATGTGPLAVQWLRDGTDIPGATSTTYVTPALALSDSNVKFSVRVSNSAGSVVSNPAALTVTTPPPIATATLAAGVRQLSAAEEALITSSTATQVTFSGPISLPVDTVVMGTSNVFKVISSRTVGTQTVFTVSEPALSEMFSSLRIRGEYTAKAADVTPASAGESPATFIASGGSRPLDAISVGQTFNWRTDFSDGGFTVTGTLDSALGATLDYDYQSGTLRKASLDLQSNNTLTLAVKYAANASTAFEKKVASALIPISVTVLDSALGAVGVRVVGIYVPVYVGGHARAAFATGAEASVKVNGSVHVGYEPVGGPIASTAFTGSIAAKTLTPSTPAGTPSYATLNLTGDVYVRMAPALTFLNKVALLGVDTSISVDNTTLLQAIPPPSSPAYCVTSNSSLNFSANGFFKAVGIQPLTTSAYTAKLYEAPTQYLGTCLAPVSVSGNAAQTTPTPFGTAIPITATIALDTANSNGATPSAAPSGKVTLSAVGATCDATLATFNATSATATCSLAPLASGLAVPVRVSYAGDTKYAPASTTTTVKVAASLGTLLGHSVTMEADYPSIGTAITQPATVTIGPGVEMSSGQMLTLGGARLIGSTIDFSASAIDIVYTQAGVASPGAFNGWVFNLPATAPTITGCSLSPLSTYTAAQVTVNCSAHQVTINEVNVVTVVGGRVQVILTLTPP